MLLNALYLESEGKLQNGPGYIRAGIEDGYDLLPQVATRLENRRRDWKPSFKSLKSRNNDHAKPVSRPPNRPPSIYDHRRGTDELNRLPRGQSNSNRNRSPGVTLLCQTRSFEERSDEFGVRRSRHQERYVNDEHDDLVVRDRFLTGFLQKCH